MSVFLFVVQQMDLIIVEILLVVTMLIGVGLHVVLRLKLEKQAQLDQHDLLGSDQPKTQDHE